MAGRDRVEMGQSQPSLTLPGAAALASYFCFSQRAVTSLDKQGPTHWVCDYELMLCFLINVD